MSRAQGARAALALSFESAFSVAPGPELVPDWDNPRTANWSFESIGTADASDVYGTFTHAKLLGVTGVGVWKNIPGAPVVPGETYHCSMWMKEGTDTDARFTVRMQPGGLESTIRGPYATPVIYQQNGGTIANVTSTDLGGGVWLWEFDLTVGAGQTLADACPGNRNAGQTIIFFAASIRVPGSQNDPSYYRVPFISSTLSAEQNLLANEVLGFGRDPLAPSRDAVNVDGTVVVPLDVYNFGLWLKGAFGAPVSTGSGAASGSITFAQNPTAGQTITLNGTVWTFRATGATGNETNIGVSLAATLTTLAIDLNASGVSAIAAATYTATATELQIAYDAAGAAGNAYTLACDTGLGTVSAATLSGGTTTHTFTSGSWSIPSMALETQIPEIPKYSLFSGSVVDSLTWEMKRSGLLQATVKLISQHEAAEVGSQAGVLTSLDYKRFNQVNGTIKRAGSALSNVTQARFNYMNNLDRIDAIRGDGEIEGADPSIAACTGQIVSRFADRVLLDQAIAGEACELEFSHVLSSTEKLVVTVHAVYLPRPRTEITGPAGIDVTFDWQAAQTNTGGPMVTAVLTNHLSAY